jgi:hypothetical protein
MATASPAELGPPELLKASRDLLTHPPDSLAGVWPRAAAFLARQALEAALRSFWVATAPGAEACSARAQFLCLKAYLDDDDLAWQAAVTWAALSQACHHHPYELAPVSSELAYWIDSAELLVERAAGMVSVGQG